MFAVLLVGGFFKSLEFTSINAIAYADIGTKAMSRATSFASVVQHLSLSAGVAFGALVLEVQRMGRPDPRGGATSHSPSSRWRRSRPARRRSSPGR